MKLFIRREKRQKSVGQRGGFDKGGGFSMCGLTRRHSVYSDKNVSKNVNDGRGGEEGIDLRKRGEKIWVCRVVNLLKILQIVKGGV